MCAKVAVLRDLTHRIGKLRRAVPGMPSFAEKANDPWGSRDPAAPGIRGLPRGASAEIAGQRCNAEQHSVR